jgi:hypothetical protein
MTVYNSSSPYASTQIVDDQYLDLLTIRPIPAKSDDILYTVEPQYNHRPDLLAYDLYGNQKLWWVFAQRNMDTISDPVYDLVSGVEIYLPQGPALRQILGV